MLLCEDIPIFVDALDLKLAFEKEAFLTINFVTQLNYEFVDVKNNYTAVIGVQKDDYIELNE